MSRQGRKQARLGRWAVAGAVVAGAGILARRSMSQGPAVPRRAGFAADGMEFEALGVGRLSLLVIPGGPGSEIPTGLMRRMTSRQHAPFVDAGYTVWQVTRRRHMPPGHTVSDMADDYARFIEEEMGGQVDLVMGVSYGGLIAQYLAADHPARVRRVVLALAAATITEWGKQLDARWARARAEGRHAQAGEAMLEYMLPGEERAGLRRRLGPLAGRMFAHSPVPSGDLLVEADAEVAFDGRDVLPRIQAPVLILCGDEDEFFTQEAVEETADLIPDSTVRFYQGMNHMQAAMSSRLPTDVLEWVEEHEAGAST